MLIKCNFQDTEVLLAWHSNLISTVSFCSSSLVNPFQDTHFTIEETRIPSQINGWDFGVEAGEWNFVHRHGCVFLYVENEFEESPFRLGSPAHFCISEITFWADAVPHSAREGASSWRPDSSWVKISLSWPGIPVWEVATVAGCSPLQHSMADRPPTTGTLRSAAGQWH